MARTKKERITRAWLHGSAALMLVATASAAAVERVTVVMNPATAQSNRAWATGGSFDLDPVFQRLIGNDPETGQYDNSALAESWETNAGFTVWTFRLKPEARWHGDWGDVTAADVAHSYEIQTGPDAVSTGLQALQGAEVENRRRAHDQVLLRRAAHGLRLRQCRARLDVHL